MTSEKSRVLKDYSLEQVSLDQRKPWIDLAIVWIGAAIVISALLRGMMIGMGLGSIKSVLLAYLLGEVLLIGMMSLTGFIGAKTGLSTPMLARLAFGSNGNLLISTLVGLTFMGWFGVQVGLFAEAVRAYSGTTIPITYITFFSGIILMIPAIFGFKGLKALSYVAVPVMIIIFLYGAVKMGHNFLPPDKLIALAKSHSPSPYPVTLGAAASIIAGGFVVGAVTSADVFRYAQPKFKDILYAASLSMGISVVMQVIGSFFSMTTGLYHEHLPDIIISPEYAGLGLIGFIAIGFAQWTNIDINLYSSVLAFNNIIKCTRWKLAVVVGFLSCLLGAFGILQSLGMFLSLLSISVGPIGGILITDYYLLKQNPKYNNLESNQARWKPIALIVYGIAFLIGWTTSGHPFEIHIFPFSIFAFNGIISAIILYWIAMKCFAKKSDQSQI